jgi:hypothetical protein
MMRRAAPARNKRIVPAGMGTRITLAMRTMAVIGSTDEKASIIFSFNILFINRVLLLLYYIFCHCGKKIIVV